MMGFICNFHMLILVSTSMSQLSFVRLLHGSTVGVEFISRDGVHYVISTMLINIS